MAIGWHGPYPNRWRAGMTLREAQVILSGQSWACACVGPPMPSPPGTPCHCRLTVGQAEALQRAAHIVANLLQQAVIR
jgi:hypothetical protein